MHVHMRVSERRCGDHQVHYLMSVTALMSVCLSVRVYVCRSVTVLILDSAVGDDSGDCLTRQSSFSDVCRNLIHVEIIQLSPLCLQLVHTPSTHVVEVRGHGEVTERSVCV